MVTIRVLLVDDDQAVRELAASMLRAEGDLMVDTVPSGQAALDKLVTAQYDAVISEYRMPGMNGLDLLRHARAEEFQNIFLMFTGEGDEEVALDAILSGADHYLPKSGKTSQDMALLCSILRKRQKRVDEEMERRNEAAYHSLLMRMHDGFAYHRIIHDEAGRPVSSIIIDANDAFEQIFVQPNESVLGRDVRELISDVDGFEHELLNAFKDIITTGNEVRFVQRSRGLDRWYSVAIYVPEPGHFVTILSDITAQKKMEERLKRDADFFMKMFEGLPIPIWMAGPDGRCNYSNKAWLDLTGHTADEEKELPWEHSIHPEDREGACELFHKALWSRQPFRAEYRLRSKDGGYRTIIDHGHPIYDTYNDYIGFLGSCYDITERIELEGALREREERYSALFHGSYATMFLVDGETRNIVDANEAAVNFYGYPREELIGMHITKISPQADHAVADELISKGSSLRKPLRARHRLASGEMRDVELYLTVLEIDGKRLVLDLNFDITDKIAMEEVLNHQRRDHELVFNTTPALIVIRDLEGRIVRANRAYAERMGVPAERLIGMHMSELMAEDWAMTHAEDLEIIRTGKPLMSVEKAYRARDTEKRWGLVDTLPYIDDSGKARGVISFTLDITRRKLMEEELERARKKLYLLGSITRHDLLNHLTALNGYLGIAQFKQDEKLTQDYVQKAAWSGENMRKILEFSQDYERMGTQRPTWFRVQEVAEKGVAEVQAHDAKVSLELEGVEILADRMVEKVFHNLADNAVRHGNASQVRFFLEKKGEDLKIVCQDDGVGVPPGKRAGMFDDRFGHGLYLVKEVLKMTGMSIEETSPPNGARFEITVPPGNYRQA
jgi:PAS domain S-box-containing protein